MQCELVISMTYVNRTRQLILRAILMNRFYMSGPFPDCTNKANKQDTVQVQRRATSERSVSIYSIVFKHLYHR